MVYPSKESKYEIETYVITKYVWDSKLKKLRQEKRYNSRQEFHPLDVGGCFTLKPKILPTPIRRALSKAYPDGWTCINAWSIYNYLILTVLNAEYWRDADTAYVLVVNPANRIYLALEGVVWFPGGLLKATDMDGDGYLDAVLEACGGGNHCVMDYCVISFHPFRTLAYVSPGPCNIEEIRDLDGNGSQKILLRIPLLYYNLPVNNYATMTMILGYRDSKYVDVSASFPKIIRTEMEKVRTEFVKAANCYADPKKKL